MHLFCSQTNHCTTAKKGNVMAFVSRSLFVCFLGHIDAQLEVRAERPENTGLNKIQAK